MFEHSPRAVTLHICTLPKVPLEREELQVEFSLVDCALIQVKPVEKARVDEVFRDVFSDLVPNEFVQTTLATPNAITNATNYLNDSGPADRSMKVNRTVSSYESINQ